MKHPLSLALLSLLLASCTAATSGPHSLPLQERLRNPLVAERYWAEMAEHMANFVRLKDPMMNDPAKAAVIEAERTRALDRVAQARKLKHEGMIGLFAKPAGEDTEGEVLLRGNTLSFGTSFLSYPNPSVRVYLTTIIDPRDAQFPDDTSIDLGPLQTAYGPQEYAVPEGQMNEEFRTAVLYDTKLERLIGFAQLSR